MREKTGVKKNKNKRGKEFGIFLVGLFFVMIFVLISLVFALSIDFESPTLDSGNTTENDWIYVNVSSGDAIDHSTFVDFDNSLVGCELLTNGTVYDNSSYGNNGILYNHLTNTTISGKRGDAIDFDGVDDYVDCGNDTNIAFDEITLSCWVKVNTIENTNIFGRNLGGINEGDIMLFITAGNKFALQNYGLSNEVDANTTINAGQWYHLTGTVDPTSGTLLYVDGVLQNDSANYRAIQASATENFIIGAWLISTNPSGFFNGSIDDVLLFNRSLSASEISALYNATANQYKNNFTGLSNGNYTFKAYAQDSSGNVNSTEERIVTVLVNQAPVITINQPNWTNYWVSQPNNLTINTVVCSDPNGDSVLYNWTIDDVYVSNLNNITLNSSNYEAGIRNLTLTCSDNGGLSASQSFNIEILKENEFLLIALPDTQNYVQNGNYPYIFDNQTYWIKEMNNYATIPFVTQLGDLVQTGNVNSQWVDANESMSILDGIVPYSVDIGNHDYNDEPFSNRSATSFFNTYFNISRFFNIEPIETGDSRDNNGENTYFFFNQSGMEFMVVNLEFCPRDAVISWANEVISNNSEKRVIITSHLYMNYDDTRVNESDQYSCEEYSGAVGDYNDGDDMWENLVQNHSNIFLVMSGHILGDGTGYRKDTGIYGNTVHQILSNYQTGVTGSTNGGNGYLRIYKFSPDDNLIQTKTYSPYVDSFKTESDQEFKMYYKMKAININFINPTPLNGSSQSNTDIYVNVSSGDHSTFVDLSY